VIFSIENSNPNGQTVKKKINYKKKRKISNKLSENFSLKKIKRLKRLGRRLKKIKKAPKNMQNSINNSFSKLMKKKLMI
jgi:hypothetical protein